MAARASSASAAMSNRPGVYELPMGYNLKKMIYEVGGGIPNGKKLKAVVPGGASCPILRADEIDVGMDFDQMGKAGTMLGSGGVVVLDETVSIVEFALRTIKFYQHESCGWCIPCREGTDWLKKTMTRFYAGGGIRRTSITFATSPKTCWAAPSARSAMRRRCRRSGSSRSSEMSSKSTSRHIRQRRRRKLWLSWSASNATKESSWLT